MPTGFRKRWNFAHSLSPSLSLSLPLSRSLSTTNYRRKCAMKDCVVEESRLAVTIMPIRESSAHRARPFSVCLIILTLRVLPMLLSSWTPSQPGELKPFLDLLRSRFRFGEHTFLGTVCVSETIQSSAMTCGGATFIQRRRRATKLKEKETKQKYNSV